MFYFAFVFLFISIFLLIAGRKDVSIRYFVGVMFSYTLALFFMMIWLAKDTYYNNIIMNYFSMPLAVWKFLMFLPVGKTFILCLWNLSCLAVPYFSLCFALSFIRYGHRKQHIFLKRAAAAVLLTEYILYHPLTVKYLYLLLYPSFFTGKQLDLIRDGIHRATFFINITIIAASIIMLVYSYHKVTPLKIIRHNMALVVCSYILIMGSYLFVLGVYPAFLMKVSKIAGYVSFISVSMDGYEGIHNIFPYYLMGMLLLIGLFLYRFNRNMKKINQKNATLSKQIAASDTTSKVFCHYMKNELLAVQSELEELACEKGESEPLQNAIQRCSNLYSRLDIIHNSTKASELYMVRINICDFLKECLSNISYDLTGYHVVFQAESTDLFVMMDTNYFEQALHNIFLNAADAMKGLPPGRQNLTVTVRAVNNWISIFIKDTGVGISAENLEKIFTPFYTSHPLTRHWGIGLTLAHKIIMAHEGYIEIESEPDYGSTVKIMLPLLNA